MARCSGLGFRGPLDDEMIKDYKDLKVWQKGIDLVKQTYAVTEVFPSTEKYSLAAQMRRAAVSIPSNIAEGFARKNTKEYRQFLFIALSSCAELDTQLIIAEDQKLLNQNTAERIKEELNHEMRMIRNLTKNLVSS